jgi:hypothetical protein
MLLPGGGVESGMSRGRRGTGLPWVVVGCVRASEPSPFTASSPSTVLASSPSTVRCQLPQPRARLGTDPPPHVRPARHMTSVLSKILNSKSRFLIDLS